MPVPAIPFSKRVPIIGEPFTILTFSPPPVVIWCKKGHEPIVVLLCGNQPSSCEKCGQLYQVAAFHWDGGPEAGIGIAMLSEAPKDGQSLSGGASAAQT